MCNGPKLSCSYCRLRLRRPTHRWNREPGSTYHLSYPVDPKLKQTAAGHEQILRFRLPSFRPSGCRFVLRRQPSKKCMRNLRPLGRRSGSELSYGIIEPSSLGLRGMDGVKSPMKLCYGFGSVITIEGGVFRYFIKG